MNEFGSYYMHIGIYKELYEKKNGLCCLIITPLKTSSFSRFVLWWRSFLCRTATVFYLSLLWKDGLYRNISSRTCCFWTCRNINRGGKLLQHFFITVKAYENFSSRNWVYFFPWSVCSFKCWVGRYVPVFERWECFIKVFCS